MNINVEMYAVNCGSCGGVYAITERYRVDCERKARRWRCPYCAARCGYSVSEADRLQERLRQAQERLDAEMRAHDVARRQRDRNERRRRSQKAACTRLRAKV